MIRLDSPHDMTRLAGEGLTLRIDATLAVTAPLRHNVRRSTWTRDAGGRLAEYRPTTPVEVAAHRLKELPDVGPYMDAAEIFGGFPLGVAATLFPIVGGWRPVAVVHLDFDRNPVDSWLPQFDEWTAAGTFAVAPDWWTPEAFRERVDLAGDGRFRVAAWSVGVLAARRVS